MDMIVGIFALVVAAGCVIAIFLASRRDNKKHSEAEDVS